MSQLTGSVATGADEPPRPAEAYLSHWKPDGEQLRWFLAPRYDPLTIGRSSTADIRIPWDSRVSRLHAALELIGAHWTLVDDGLSRNGTFVNGARLSGRLRLRDRDTIRVGTTPLTFCAPDQTATQHTVAGDAPPGLARITGPQRAVLVALCRPFKDGRLYATPASNQRVAEELFLSLDAVKTHLRTLFHKFGIEDLPQNQKRARLVEMALELGVVTENEL